MHESQSGSGSCSYEKQGTRVGIVCVDIGETIPGKKTTRGPLCSAAKHVELEIDCEHHIVGIRSDEDLTEDFPECPPQPWRFPSFFSCLNEDLQRFGVIYETWWMGPGFVFCGVEGPVKNIPCNEIGFDEDLSLSVKSESEATVLQ